MPKISGLIFSADPIKETLATAKHLLEFTDEVVVIYSRSYRDYKKFKAQNKDRRIRIFYTLRFGYPEPFRTYGISLCKYRNIALLDVDERFSSTEAVKRLFDSEKSEVYVLHRKESPSGSYTRQYRLFTKGAIVWRGYLHETPKITGKRTIVPKELLYIIHGEGNKGRWHYNELDKSFPVDRPIRMALREAYVMHGSGKLPLLSVPLLTLQKYSEYKKMNSDMPAKSKQIIRKLREQGLIRYLGLDDPKNIKAITDRYKDKKQGIYLLIKLIGKQQTKP